MGARTTWTPSTSRKSAHTTHHTDKYKKVIMNWTKYNDLAAHI